MKKLWPVLFFLCGCSMFGKNSGREISVVSNIPEAEVSYYQAAEKRFEVLGKTPLVITTEKIKEWLKSGQGFAILKISKSGYVVENLYLDLSHRYKVEYSSELKPLDVWNEKEFEVSSFAANKLAQKIQQINHSIFKKNFDSALSATEKLIDQFPKAHVFYDMKGSILLLMGKKGEATTSYQRSLSLNPDNVEAKVMLQKIQGGVQ